MCVQCSVISIHRQTGFTQCQWQMCQHVFEYAVCAVVCLVIVRTVP
jgi:hypothetical protein